MWRQLSCAAALTFAACDGTPGPDVVGTTDADMVATSDVTPTDAAVGVDTPGAADTAAPQDTADVAMPDTASPDVGGPAPDTTTAVSCPPGGPYGTSVGDTLPEASLVDCDGNAYPLYQLCDRPATVLFTFAGWCPPCRSAAEAAAADLDALQATNPGATMVIVLTETSNGSAPTAEYCKAIRDAYALDMPVLFDPAGGFPAHIGVTSPNSWHLVFAPGMRLVFKDKYAQAGSLEAARGLLNP